MWLRCSPILLFFVVYSHSAVATGFRVQPSIIEFEISPGRVAVTTVQLTNPSLVRDVDILIEPYETIQGVNGSMSFSEARTSNSEVGSSPHSCVSWIVIPEQSTTLAPGESREIEVRFVVPTTAVGDNVGAIGFRTVPRNGEGQIALSVRLMTLVEISVVGRTATRKLDLAEPKLAYHPAVDESSAHETVTIGVHNVGESTVHVEGTIVINEIVGERSRRVMAIPLNKIKVMPGSRFDIVQKTQRRLPSGRYSVTADLMSDQRHFVSRALGVDFLGDPSISELVADAIVLLDPPVLETDGTPRAKRRQFATIKNDSADTLSVRLRVDPVSQLETAYMGSVLGVELLCHEWASVEPRSITMPPGAVRRVAVVWAFPESDVLRPSSYGILNMEATYEDGQHACGGSILLVARDARAQPVRKLEILRASLMQIEKAKYSISVEYGNTGETDLRVVWDAEVFDYGRRRRMQAVAFSEDGRPVLPMGKYRTEGTLDIDDLDVGSYWLTLNARHDGVIAGKVYDLEVREQAGRKWPVLSPKKAD